MTTAYEQVVLADSPLRLYPCNDTAAPLADISGNAQSAVVSGSPTYGAAGLLNSESSTALANTLTSYATIPTVGLPTGNSPISLEVWVKCTARQANYKGIFSVGSQVASESINLGYNTSNVLYGELKGTGVNGLLTTLNAIYHLVVTWDGTTLTFYVNGVSQGTVTPGAANLTYGAAILDAFSDSTSRSGWTDQYAAIYGVALSQARVTAHYNAGFSFLVSAALAGSGGMSAQPTALASAALAGSGAISAQSTALVGAALVGAGAVAAQPVALVGAGLAGSGGLAAQPTALVSAGLAGVGALWAQPTALVAAALAGVGTLKANATVLLPPPAGVSVALVGGPSGVGITATSGPSGVSIAVK